jgi:hypothetical protein
MRSFDHRRLAALGRRVVLAGGVVAAAASLLASTAAASATGPVSSTPVTGTPQLAPTGTTEQVRQLVQCGGTMYAVGTFSEIKRNSTVYQRNNIFSFSATSPYTVTPWAPDVNGEVNSIAFNGGNCSDAYIGGSFTSVDGTSANNIAEISTSTGAVVTSFQDNANGAVETLVAAGGHLLTGGHFTTINGSSADHYLASLNPATGQDDGYLHLSISGNYQYPGVGFNHTMIYNQQLSHDGTRDLVEGVFSSVGGLPRQQIFMLDLGSASGTVSGWTSSEFSLHCADKHPFYVKAASWSPDDGTVYVATTGRRIIGTPSFPLTGLCDVVAAFPSAEQAVSHEWANYTGCDSFFSTAADTSAVYAGGHERWADNANGCDHAGPGAVTAPGMGGFTPSSGSVLMNSAGTAGLYSRGRGIGADDMLLTSAGLWIASDNEQDTAMCGGVFGHAGICFLPYA